MQKISPLASGGFRWFPAVSGGFRRFPAVSRGATVHFNRIFKMTAISANGYDFDRNSGHFEKLQNSTFRGGLFKPFEVFLVSSLIIHFAIINSFRN